MFGIKHFLERIDKLNTLYFLNENEENVAKVILNYLESNEEGKQKILEENY